VDLYNKKYDKSINNEEMMTLAKLGCNVSKTILFENNIALIRKLAHKWKSNGSHESIEDLMSIGYIGLTLAYNNFDSSKNTKFTTYAGRLVWQEFIKVARANSMKCRSKYYSFSIDEPLPEESDASSWHEVLADNNTTNEYIEVENEIYENKFKKYIRNSNQFNKNERKVVRDYFFKGKAISDIGRDLKMTRQGAHLIYKRCISKILSDRRMVV
jgi:RNA polymerase sporulation-specific sigma factor